ncbi:hypothetical protein [Cohnella luojiensis]|uniref:hypothetical protein n=1 Tax=Cohnella luojiensis TaxID=652876 RepID=UPI00142F70D8|nr:hypothetical protein [Cohnella luojiensis]
MHEESFSLAALQPEEVEEIKEMELRMSEKVGHPISLIAYQADLANNGKPD